jgi:hypothetical protein
MTWDRTNSRAVKNLESLLKVYLHLVLRGQVYTFDKSICLLIFVTLALKLASRFIFKPIRRLATDTPDSLIPKRFPISLNDWGVYV